MSVVSKFRIRFTKADDLRFLSHHDLMRLWERMLRRAGLPFRSSQGFHPKPKVVFAGALALGIAGHEEVVEIEFDGELAEAHVQAALQAQAPEGLTLRSIQRIPIKMSGQIVKAVYRLAIPSEVRDTLGERLAALLAAPELWIDRPKHSGPRTDADEPAPEERFDVPLRAKATPPPTDHRRLNIRPFIGPLQLSGDSLLLELLVTPHGAARPEEVLRLLGVERLFHHGESVLERIRLVLADELPSTEREPHQAITAPGDPPPAVADWTPEAGIRAGRPIYAKETS